jgi:hypothetical protein
MGIDILRRDLMPENVTARKGESGTGINGCSQL